MSVSLYVLVVLCDRYLVRCVARCHVCVRFASHVRSEHRIRNHGEGLTPTEVDMIFIQCKDRKGRRLDYIQFLTACDRMAQVKYPDDGAQFFALHVARKYSHTLTHMRARAHAYTHESLRGVNGHITLLQLKVRCV